MKGDSVKSKSGADLRAQFEARMAERVDPKKSAAHGRAETIRNGIRGWVKMRAAIVEAFALDDWVTLGYSSWQAYLDTEFSLKELRLTAEQLRESAVEFQAAGMNLREIGAATGTSKDTAKRALKSAEVDLPVSRETKPPLVNALRGAIEDAAISADSFRCEKCDRLLAEGIVRAAQRRCLNCDVNREHFATEVGGPCLACKTPTGSTSPEPVGPQHSPAAATSLTSPHAGVPAVGGQNEERIEEEAVEFYAAIRRQFDALNLTHEQLAEMAAVDDFPSLAAKKLWLAIKDSPAADPMAPPSPQQPGHISPTGVEGSRSETDHHMPGGEPGSGEAPGPPVPVEPELEGGGGTSLASLPSSDPDVLVELFQAFVQAIDRVDIEAIAPMLLADDIEQLEIASDRIATFVGLIEKYHSP